MYDLNRIKKEFYEACESQGVELKLPISINSRLTRTLGRVIMISNRMTGKTTLREVEFSKQLIETASDESIRGVILHEAAHVIATFKTGEDRGHDGYFKSICHALGTSNDGYSTTVERTVEVKNKYDILCENCGKIGGYSRMTNTLRNLKYCTCKKCGQSKLSYVQNW